MDGNNNIYAELLSAVVRFDNLSTVFYFDPENGKEHCHVKQLLPIIGKTIPLVLWSSVQSFKLSSFVNTQLLVLACFPGVYRQDLLNSLSNTLRFMRQTKVLIEVAGTPDVVLVTRVLKYSLQSHMINAALIFGDFVQTQTLYSYEAYPNFMLKDQKFSKKELPYLFPDKTYDLQGTMLRTMPDFSEPKTIFYVDKKGHYEIIGYVSTMLEEYARKHNASLHMIRDVRKRMALTHIQALDLARDNVVDIMASVQPLATRHVERFHEYAYPVEVTSWCTMMPMEPLIEVREMYSWMMPGVTLSFLLLLWLIRELINGRWHRHRRLWGISWKVLAIILACNVQGRLFTFFIAPPAMPAISNFAALSKSKLRIYGTRSDHNLYDFDLRTKYSSAFYLCDQITDQLRLRNSLNTTFAYTVTHTKWQLYAEQMALMSRPLFYYSQKFCFYQFMPFALVIPENSPHRATLHHFTLQVGESGLYMHWVSKSFYYMKLAGRLNWQDLDVSREYASLSTQDLQCVLLAYALGVVISLILFTAEMFLYRVRIWLAI